MQCEVSHHVCSQLSVSCSVNHFCQLSVFCTVNHFCSLLFVSCTANHFCLRLSSVLPIISLNYCLSPVLPIISFNYFLSCVLLTISVHDFLSSVLPPLCTFYIQKVRCNLISDLQSLALHSGIRPSFVGNRLYIGIAIYSFFFSTIFMTVQSFCIPI